MEAPKERQPLLNEPHKRILIMSQSANSVKTKAIVDFLCKVKHTAVKYVDKDGQCLPSIENNSANNGRLEQLLRRMGASLFIYLHPTKEGKTRFICGRSFEYELTDMCMFDFAISEGAFADLRPPYMESNALCIVFANGRHSSPRTQNFLLDLFRGEVPRNFSLVSCTHVFCLTFCESGTVLLDLYKISGPVCTLSPLCAQMSLSPITSFHCDEETFKASKKTASQTKKPVKNVVDGDLKTKYGVLHIEQQNLREIKLSKGKAFKTAK